MFSGAKFDNNSKTLKIGKVRLEVDSPEVTADNFETFNYKFDPATKKLSVDTVEPGRKTHAITYTAPKGAKIISVNPGIVAYRFSFDEDQFSIIGREMPEVFSNRTNPLTLIVEMEPKTYVKVSFIEITDKDNDDIVIGHDMKKYVVKESDFMVNTYVRLFDGTNFVNRFKMKDDAIIITANKMPNQKLQDYFGGYNPDKNKTVELPIGINDINDAQLICRSIEAYRDRKVVFMGYPYDVVKKLRSWHDCLKTKRSYNSNIKMPSSVNVAGEKKA